MDQKWLSGFIEGTGCFSIIIRKSHNSVGYQTITDFTVKLPLEQKPLLEEIQSHLGLGKVYSNQKGALLKATKLEDAKKLIVLFDGKFISPAKAREFSVWKDCVSLMEKGLHHTHQGLLEIAHLRDSIHVKKLWNKKNFCSLRVELDPCHIYQKEKHLPQGCRICWGGEFKDHLVKLPIKEVEGGMTA